MVKVMMVYGSKGGERILVRWDIGKVCFLHSSFEDHVADITLQEGLLKQGVAQD